MFGRVFLFILVFAAGSAKAAEMPQTQAMSKDGGAAANMTFRHVRNQILLDIRIGDEGPFTFLLDTGVTPSGIDVELARRLELPSEENRTGEASGAGTKRVRIFPVTITDVEIAGVAIGDVEAVAFPMAGLSEKIGEPLHGILGHSFLKSRVVRIDYVDHTFSFSLSPAPFANDFEAASFVTPLVYGEGDIMPIVEVTLGGKAFVASIDTGSSLGLEIFSDAVEKLGLTDTIRDWTKGEVTGARGKAEIRSGSLPEVEIGPLSFTDVPAGIGPRRGGDYRDGNIGNRMWADYVLVFDYVDRRVAFRKVDGNSLRSD